MNSKGALLGVRFDRELSTGPAAIKLKPELESFVKAVRSWEGSSQWPRVLQVLWHCDPKGSLVLTLYARRR